MRPDPGAVRLCCGRRWPRPVPGHTDGQGCRGGGHSTAPGKPQPASCPGVPPPGLLQAQGYSRPSAPLLFWVFLSLSLGIPTTQGPYSALGWLAHPAVPSHTPQRRLKVDLTLPLSCYPLPTAVVVPPRVCLLSRRVWTLTLGIYFSGSRHPLHPASWVCPHPPEREGRLPRDTASPHSPLPFELPSPDGDWWCLAVFSPAVLPGRGCTLLV